MALASIKSIALVGIEGHLIEIEVDIGEGLPGYTLLGLPDAALSESRERVRTAIINTGAPWPNKRVTVSLSPAWLPKGGSSFDLPIALALLAAQGVIPQTSIDGVIALGELALDGSIRAIQGALPSLIAGVRNSISTALIPAENYGESRAVEDIHVIAPTTLAEAIEYARDGVLPSVELARRDSKEDHYLDLSDVVGQGSARYALEVAATGAHHLLLVGPPGTGKTMLAERIPSIMPPLTRQEALEVGAVHSIAGTFERSQLLSHVPPFVSPHHTTTSVAMVGGGAHLIRPGACSLAHGGVLFIDEAPECKSGVLDALRQPLESGRVTISRSSGTISYPARFLLVLAANPCPCGKFAGRGRNCSCAPIQIKRYLKKISGPLLDRIDIRSFVETPSRTEMASDEMGESSELVRARVIAAREVARERFASVPWSLNSEIPASALRKRFRAAKEGMVYLHNELEAERLSARGFHKVLRVAWSIADLKGHTVPNIQDIEMACALREGGELFR